MQSPTHKDIKHTSQRSKDEDQKNDITFIPPITLEMTYVQVPSLPVKGKIVETLNTFCLDLSHIWEVQFKHVEQLIAIKPNPDRGFITNEFRHVPMPGSSYTRIDPNLPTSLTLDLTTPITLEMCNYLFLPFCLASFQTGNLFQNLQYLLLTNVYCYDWFRCEEFRLIVTGTEIAIIHGSVQLQRREGKIGELYALLQVYSQSLDYSSHITQKILNKSENESVDITPEFLQVLMMVISFHQNMVKNRVNPIQMRAIEISDAWLSLFVKNCNTLDDYGTFYVVGSQLEDFGLFPKTLKALKDRVSFKKVSYSVFSQESYLRENGDYGFTGG